MSGKEQIKNANIPQMNINRLVDELTTAYCNIINANVPIRKFPSVMLWGAPGVGKSQAVRQIGKEIESQTGKKVHITDVRCSFLIRLTCVVFQLQMQTRRLPFG